MMLVFLHDTFNDVFLNVSISRDECVVRLQTLQNCHLLLLGLQLNFLRKSKNDIPLKIAQDATFHFNRVNH